MNEPVVKESLTTDAERLAVALFGWQRNDSRNDNPEHYREYSQTNSNDGPCLRARYRIKRGDEVFGDRRWPDLTHERLKYYWVRRMEDALAARGLAAEYVDTLDAYTLSDPTVSGLSWREAILIRATTAQRVAAAIRCLDGEGL